MTLLTPLALALTALAVPVVAMYILKLRRQQQVISSTLLWQRALDDVQANAPWQRLRPSILLLLQLLALLALVLALAQPAYSSAHHFSGDLILIVDESYGMQAHDVAPSRFSAALAQAHTLANDLPAGNVVSVIGMGAEPALKTAESSDAGAIGRAIDSLRVGVSAPNFLAALSFAASLARNGQTTRAVVLTSRESGISALPLRVPFPVEIVRIGGHLRDLGVTAFSATQGGSHTQALARVGNFGANTAGSDLNLYVDGQLADVRPLTVVPGKQQTLFWTDLPPRPHTLQIKLTHADDVSTDKAAWAVSTIGSQRRILLVTNNDFFLQTALALDPSVQLSLLTPSAYRASLAPRYDLIVFDGMLPSVLPTTPVLLVSPPPGHTGAIAIGANQPGGTVTSASAPASASIASLLQFVDLSDVHVGRARAVTVPGWMLPVASSGGATVLAAGENSGTRVALMPFNLQESDWPLRISFPILMQNLVHYLAPGLELGTAEVAAGQSLQFSPPPGTRQIDIARPDGGTVSMGPPFPPFIGTTQPGLYTATTVGGFRPSTSTFAVNFFPARPAPAVGRSHVVLGQSQSGSSRIVGVPVSVGWAFALAVLALLSAEWWFAFRR